MASTSARPKPVGRLLLSGVITAGLYTALLTNQETINKTFAQGGLFALLPIVTAFAFSIAHGEFTGSFWSVLGIEAAKKKKEIK